MRFPMILLAVLVAVCGGCATHSNDNSLVWPATLVNVTSAPLAGNIKGNFDLSELKCGESEETMYFTWPYPPISVMVDDESIANAVRNGGLNEVVYADYEIRHYVVVSFFTVRAYGR